MPGTEAYGDELPAHITPSAAMALQKQLAGRVSLDDRIGRVTRVAGVDCGFPGRGDICRAAAVLCSYPDLEVLEQSVSEQPTPLPYIPGLLSFRELPAVLAALEDLSHVPDLVLCDGQGIAHPRRLGIAAHLGVITGLPCIGVAKSRLTGDHGEPGNEKGDWSTLTDCGETIGSVLRTRTGIKPVFVSPGYGMDFAAARRWVLDCTGRYKLPEPIRAADRLASRRSKTTT